MEEIDFPQENNPGAGGVMIQQENENFLGESLENLSVQNRFRPCQFVFGMIQNSNFIVRPILTKFQVNFVLQLLFGLQIIRIVQKRIFTFAK